MSRRIFAVATAAATLLVWLAAHDLPDGVRFWTTVLLVPFPALMVMQARLQPDLADVRREPLYLVSALTLWLLALATLAIAIPGGIGAYQLGLFTGNIGEQLLWATAITVLAEGVYLAAHRLGLREAPLLVHLLPRTKRERIGFAALSVSAGCCEELVFRGFLLTALSAATGSLTLALILSSLTFGVTHAYQEPAGAARATLLGLLLAAPVIATGSLLGAAVAHTAIDILGGFWLGPRLTRADGR